MKNILSETEQKKFELEIQTMDTQQRKAFLKKKQMYIENTDYYLDLPKERQFEFKHGYP